MKKPVKMRLSPQALEDRAVIAMLQHVNMTQATENALAIMVATIATKKERAAAVAKYKAALAAKEEAQS